MLAAAALTLWSAVDYLVRARCRPSSRHGLTMARVLRHRRLRLHRRRAARPAAGARRRRRRARALRRARRRRSPPAAPRWRAATCSTRSALGRGDARLRARLPRRRDQHAVPDRPGRAVPRQRARGGGGRRAPRRAPASGALVLTSSAAALGEAHGTVGQRGLAAPRHVPVGLRALQARRRAGGAGGRPAAGRRRRGGQPVLRAGPRPRRRHGPDPHRLPQRPPEGVRRHDDQPRRHRRRGGGPPARRRARDARASATSCAARR